MIKLDQLAVLAELDGWTISHKVGAHPLGIGTAKSEPKTMWKKNGIIFEEWQRPGYLHSYDAIIPLIIKRLCKIESSNMERYDKFGKMERYDKFGKILSRIRLGYDESYIDYAAAFVVFMRATTEQLCEALLRYEGKWKE